MLTKLTRETLTEQATQQLLAFIQAEHPQPGSLLPAEAKLAEQLGVSRPVIREALRALAGRGIVEIINGKGAIVRPVSSEMLAAYFQRSIELQRTALLELMEVRRGLEMQTATLAAQRRTPEELQLMQQTIDTMRQHLDAPERYIELDLQLHLQIAAATHNTMLYHLVESIRESAKGAIQRGFLLLQTHAGRERVQLQHQALIDAIAQGQAAAASQTMAEHLDNAVERLIRAAEASA